MAGDGSCETSRVLGVAASLLDAVGSDRDRIPALVAEDCRRAADLLRQSGGPPTPDVMPVADPSATVREAITMLSKLSSEQLSSEPMLTAVTLMWHIYVRIG